MKDALIKNMELRFSAYSQVVSGCSDATLQAKLDIPRHKSLAEHLWCIVGARESYSAAIEADQWQGFSCSLQGFSQSDFSSKLEESAAFVLSTLTAVEEWTATRTDLLLALNEHEVMHEGQMIRHLYGLGLDIPESVKWS